MGAFGGLILTNKGRALQAKAQTGVQLNFTKVKVGDGSLSGQSILELNDLISPKKELSILELKTLPEGKASLKSFLSNSDITTGFYWRELGVFAQDPDEGEILYCYGNAGENAEYIPAGGEADVVEKYINIVTLVSNASNVSATLGSEIYVTQADFNAHVSNTSNPHNVTVTQIGAETPAGAQAKADAAEANAKNYADQKFEQSSYSTPVEETAEIISLPANTVKGQISAVVDGRTLTNGFGNKGRFDDITLLNGGVRATASTVADGIYGSNALEITIDTGYTDGYGYVRLTDYVQTGKYYIVLCDIKNVNGTKVKFGTSLDCGVQIVSEVTDTRYTLAYSIINPTHVDNIIASNGYVYFWVYGSEGQKGRFDGARIYEITEEEYNKIYNGEYTSVEIADKYRYVDNVKSTLNTRLRSVGKNLFNGKKIVDSLTLNYGNTIKPYFVDGEIRRNASGEGSWKTTIQLRPNTDYTIQSKRDVDGVFVYINNNDFTNKSLTFNSGSDGIVEFKIYYAPGSTENSIVYDIQLEQGTTATSYEPYKESVVYLNETLRSLPNGVKDEVNVAEGKKIQRTKEYTLQSGDIAALDTSTYTNLDIVKISYTNISDAKYANTYEPNGTSVRTDRTVPLENNTPFDSTENEWKHYFGTSYFIFLVPKGYYADLAAAQADLAGTPLIYQLAESATKDLDITPIQCFENGTLYVEQTVRDSGIYSGGLSVTNTNLPIKSLEKVYKVEGDTKTPVALSNCTVAADGLSFTIAGAFDGERYEFIYNYPSELGTIPLTEYSVPLNRAKQIDDNTDMINQLSKELGDMWETLLPLADKELAMALISEITTDMSADANDNELKNKINEILAVWQ